MQTLVARRRSHPLDARFHARAAVALLAAGRCAEALEAVRRARRSRSGTPPAVSALQEAEALSGLQRYEEALAVLTRALARPPAEADAGARLRQARGEALWYLGRVRDGRAEAERALAQATAPLTRGRAYEALGVFAWKRADFGEAELLLGSALEVYGQCGSVEGTVRVLEHEAGALRDAGRLEDALAAHEHGIAVAAASTRRDLLARAHAGHATLLTALGRWAEARAQAARSARLFAEIGDPREHTGAGLVRAILSLAAGEADAARELLDAAARANAASQGDARSRAEERLARADLELCCERPRAAEEAATAALVAFERLHDADGSCRARVRRVEALLALDRLPDARREASRAVKHAPPARPDLRCLAALVVGQAAMRTGARERALASFEAARAIATGRDGFVQLARFGCAMAAEERDPAEAKAALEGLLRWGDRRLTRIVDGERRRHAAGGACDAAAALPEAPVPSIPGILGGSEPMRKLFRAVERFAASEDPVHVFGETGAGKEGVARALHERSLRSRGPFVVVNAASLADDLFESQMCGHVRGAFTGAVADRPGYLAEANGGTLFLDEVVDLTPRAQSKLLRILETKEYRRVGETHVRRSDFRLVTAANVPLDARVRAGLLREDVKYRIDVLRVSVPPLRERGEDVLLLARHFAREAASRSRRAPAVIPPEVAAALQAHAWPGNVRELMSVMSALVAHAEAGRVHLEHLPPALAAASGPRAPSCLRQANAGFERSHIGKELERHAQNRARTAAALGISRQALIAKMKRLGL